MLEERYSQITHTKCCDNFIHSKLQDLKLLLIAGPITLETKAKIIWETLYVERNSFQILISS